MAGLQWLGSPNHWSLFVPDLKDMLQLDNNLNLKRSFRSQLPRAVRRLWDM